MIVKKNVIYKISNTINHKVYLGQARNFSKRWIAHKSDARKGSNMYIHRAMRKYGEDKFSIDIIFNVFDETDLNWAESELIKQWDCCAIDGEEKGYNLLRGGEFMDSEASSLYNKKLVEEGTHKFMGKRGSEFATERNKKAVLNGTNVFCGERGSILSKETNKKRMTDGTHNVLQIHTCEYCGFTGKGMNMQRWHGENCKHSPNYKEPHNNKALVWLITHKDWNGEWIVVKNLAKFCKENNLCSGVMCNTQPEKLDNYHKGFKCKKKT